MIDIILHIQTALFQKETCVSKKLTNHTHTHTPASGKESNHWGKVFFV